MAKIIMIEDDSEFASLLSQYLAQYNLEITNYEDPFLGLSAGIDNYDLLILDLTLPGMDGLEVCKEIVSRYDIPIIISSARDDLDDKVLGLQLGADDYLPKPYEPREMYARIISLLRRYKKINRPDDTATSSLFHIHKETILYRQKALDLTPAEFEVLSLLIKNEGSTLSREQIIYSSSTLGDNYSKSLEVIISRIRQKLSDSRQIKTIRGIGYKLIS